MDDISLAPRTVNVAPQRSERRADNVREQMHVMIEKEAITYFPGSSSRFMRKSGSDPTAGSRRRPLPMAPQSRNVTDKEVSKHTAVASISNSVQWNQNGGLIEAANSNIDDLSSSIFENEAADPIYRLRMADWSYRIIDYFGASREIVAIAFDYLDRFLDSGVFLCNTTVAYKLAVITALYIALKVHNRKTIKTATLASLSKGEISVHDIISMESLMLNALSYKLCPPTCYYFVGALCNSLSSAVEKTVGPYVMHQAVFISELSVMDACFKDMKPSRIAFAAMLNVIDCLDSKILSPFERAAFLQEVETLIMLESSSSSTGPTGKEVDNAHFWSEVNRARERLSLLLAHANYTNGIDANMMTRNPIRGNCCENDATATVDLDSDGNCEGEDECRDDTSITPAHTSAAAIIDEREDA